MRVYYVIHKSKFKKPPILGERQYSNQVSHNKIHERNHTFNYIMARFNKSTTWPWKKAFEHTFEGAGARGEGWGSARVSDSKHSIWGK